MMIGTVDPDAPKAMRLFLLNHVFNMAEAVCAAGVDSEVVTKIVERHCQTALRELAAQIATEQHLFKKEEGDDPAVS